MKIKFAMVGVLLLLLLILMTRQGLTLLPLTGLDHFDDTIRISQRWQPSFSSYSCLFVIQRRQKLLTNQSESIVWQRALKQWQIGDGYVIGGTREAYHQLRLYSFLNVKTRLSFDHGHSYNSIDVNERLVVQLPIQLCIR